MDGLCIYNGLILFLIITDIIQNCNGLLKTINGRKVMMSSNSSIAKGSNKQDFNRSTGNQSGWIGLIILNCTSPGLT